MRIIGGRMRGLGLTPVGKGDAGAHLRPTTDRVRESLFNLLEGGRFGSPIDGALVLDLFAGTGALGLEALSRGAAHVTFVENGRAGGRLLTSNIARARAEGETRVLKRDATRLGVAGGEPASLVFLDPPYGQVWVPPLWLLSAQVVGSPTARWWSGRITPRPICLTGFANWMPVAMATLG